MKGLEQMERGGRRRGGKRESLSSCMTAVLARYRELFNGPVKAAGLDRSAADVSPHITSPLLSQISLFDGLGDSGVSVIRPPLINYILLTWPRLRRQPILNPTLSNKSALEDPRFQL